MASTKQSTVNQVDNNTTVSSNITLLEPGIHCYVAGSGDIQSVQVILERRKKIIVLSSALCCINDNITIKPRNAANNRWFSFVQQIDTILEVLNETGNPANVGKSP